MKALIIALLSISMCCQAEVIVIVHPSLAKNVDTDTVSRLFLGKTKTLGDGTAMVPVAQSNESPVAEEFNSKALGKSSSQLKAYWSQLVFTGKGTPPKEVANDAEMIALIAANPNLIGYIDAKSLTASVHNVATY